MSVSLQRGLFRVAEVVRGLRERASGDTAAVLHELTDNAVETVPGAQYAGITIAQRRRDIQTACSTGPYPVVLDEIQRCYGEGPCLSAALQHNSVHVDDLAADERWPRYRTAAIEQTPIRSMMSFGLLEHANTVGALNFYAENAGAFGDESGQVGLLFATHTALVWNMLRRDQQLSSALASHDVIGEAKGMLMARFGLNAVAASGVLKRLSQESDSSIAEAAERLVNSDRPPW